MAQLPSKTLSLFLAVVIIVVVWYCWHTLCGLRQFASTQSITRSVEFSRCKCSSHSTDTSLQGTAISNQYSRHFVFTRVTRIKQTLHIRSFHELLSFTIPISPYNSSFDTSQYNVDTPPVNTAPAPAPEHCGPGSTPVGWTGWTGWTPPRH